MSSQSTTRRNRASVLAAARTAGDASRAELAAATGLSVATVSRAVVALIDAGLLVEQSAVGPAGGRPLGRVRVDESAATVLAVDVADHHTTLALVDLGGTVRWSERLDAPAGADERLEHTLHAIETAWHAPHGRPRPVAIGALTPLRRVCQLLSTVGQFHPRPVQLETQRPCLVGGIKPRERRIRGGKARQEHGPISAQPRLDTMGEQQVPQPGRILSVQQIPGNIECGCTAGERGAIGQRIDADPFTEGCPPVQCGEPVRPGRCKPHDGGDLVHQGPHAPARAIPLQHRELGLVQPADLTVAVNLAQLVDRAPVLGEQALHQRLGRRLQERRTGVTDGSCRGNQRVGCAGRAQQRRIDLENTLLREVCADRREQRRATRQPLPAQSGAAMISHRPIL